MTNFKADDKAFIIESSTFVKEIGIVRIAGGFRVRESRLFAAKAETKNHAKK